jgi:sugar-specific transcriptional regulator TrmB
MLIHEECAQVLVDLGLTHLQAKVYVALLSLKSATARSVQTFSSVARQDIYPVLSELEEKGLVEKVVAKPARFRSIPVKGAISVLTQKRDEQTRQLRNKAIRHFRNFEIDCVETPLSEGASQFVLLSKSEANPTAHADKLGKAVAKVQKSVMCSTTLPLFTKIKSNDEHVWKKAVKRGVKFKCIIARGSNEKSELNLDPGLENSDNFEVRWTSIVLPSCVLVVDDKEAFCRMGSDVDCPVLWSTDPSFVALIKDYFENKWKLLEHSRKKQVSSRTR